MAFRRSCDFAGRLQSTGWKACARSLWTVEGFGLRNSWWFFLGFRALGFRSACLRTLRTDMEPSDKSQETLRELSREKAFFKQP